MTTPDDRLAWLVDDLVRRVPGVLHALLVSSDGLPMVRSTALNADAADQLAAIASGISSLTVGACDLLDGGEVDQTIVQMRRGFLVVAGVSDGSLLTALASPEADLGQVGYELAVLIESVGPVLTPAQRVAMVGGAAGGA